MWFLIIREVPEVLKTRVGAGISEFSGSASEVFYHVMQILTGEAIWGDFPKTLRSDDVILQSSNAWHVPSNGRFRPLLEHVWIDSVNSIMDKSPTLFHLNSPSPVTCLDYVQICSILKFKDRNEGLFRFKY